MAVEIPTRARGRTGRRPKKLFDPKGLAPVARSLQECRQADVATIRATLGVSCASPDRASRLPGVPTLAPV